MTKITIALCLLLTLPAKGQTISDSIKIYEEQRRELHKRYRDTLNMDPVLKEIYENIRRLSVKSDDYRGISLFFQSATADFSRLNHDIEASGFPALSGNFSGAGLGFTFKKNRRIFDFNLFTFPFDKISKKNGEKIKTSYGNIIDFIWGYDFVKSNRLNVYPYTGIGLRSSYIAYKTPAEINPAPTSFRDVMVNDRSVTDDVTTLGYQAGIGAEFVLTPRDRPSGTIIFLKAGTSRAFKEKNFDFEGVKFNADLQAGRLQFYAGIKFFGRN